jgi:hypothetical protein
MLGTIIALLVLIWLLGLPGHIGGSLIHLLLVIAAVVPIFQLIAGRRAAIWRACGYGFEWMAAPGNDEKNVI